MDTRGETRNEARAGGTGAVLGRGHRSGGTGAASLEVPVPFPLDGFLDAQQHGREPLVQARYGIELLHLRGQELN